MTETAEKAEISYHTAKKYEGILDDLSAQQRNSLIAKLAIENMEKNDIQE